MELQRIVSILDPNRTSRVSFDAFLDFMTRETIDTDTVEQIMESFRVLAAGKVAADWLSRWPARNLIGCFQPFITNDELRRELPQEQAEYCMTRMPMYQGQGGGHGTFDYTIFSRTLYGQSDL